MIRRHKIQLIDKIKFIDTTAEGTPFSFFNYIVWNKQIDIRSGIGKQIFMHELVHVKEAHSFDKFFIQIIAILFWINPFFWFIKKELRIIHEFIADEKAIQHNGASALAAMILQTIIPFQTHNISNHFFQSPIKRRLKMISKLKESGISYLSRISGIVIIGVIGFAFTLKTKITNEKVQPYSGKITVVIDAGHGRSKDGNMTGAKIDNILEDDIVLSISRKIKELNGNIQLNIFFTRTSDEAIDLKKRVDLAKENKADLFISIHLGAVPEKPDSSGMGVFVSGRGTKYQKSSELLGSIMQGELSKVYPTYPFLIKKEVGIFVLDQNICPSILIECGCLTNKKDRNFITLESNQKLIAEKILKSISKYIQASQNQSFQNDTLSGNFNISSVTLEEVKKFKGPIFIDDKEFRGPPENISLRKDNIRSINILKPDKNNLVKKLGVKAINGVIFIQTYNLANRDEAMVFVQTEKPAQFPGGTKAWAEFLGKNLKVSILEKNKAREGAYTVLIKF
ncbi:MAG TPA: M56/M15 family metallopeptidase, partial [Candidatus Nitrosocosmicus sp.]